VKDTSFNGSEEFSA
jgi:aminopeptidase N